MAIAAEIEPFRSRLLKELDRVVAALDDLDEEAVNWKPPSAGANSLLVLATHTIAAAEDHVVRRAVGLTVQRSRDVEFAAKGSAGHIRERADQVRRRIGEALESFDAARLGEERDSGSGTWTVRDALIHAVAHAAEHAGQAELTRDLLRARRS